MAQITTGIRAILSHPKVYNLVQQIVGGKKSRRIFINEYVKPFPGCKILDFGCGTGEMFPYLEEACPQINYTGIDLSKDYIDVANKKYGGRAKFVCMNVMDFVPTQMNSFDIIICTGFLHHLDDEVVNNLANSAKLLLKPEGKFLAVEPVYTEDQSKMARYIISKDRGQNVRTPEGYEKLLSASFKAISFKVYHDLLNIPYSNIVYECRTS